LKSLPCYYYFYCIIFSYYSGNSLFKNCFSVLLLNDFLAVEHCNSDQ
jgi:hypothetical protein